MRSRVLTIVLGLALGAVAADLPEAYRVIAQRNLFSPSRVATPPPTTTVSVPPPPAETVTLTGVVVLDGQATALFAGSTADLSGACHAGDSLGTLRVTTVSTAGARVDADGQEGTLRLAVGQSLRRLQGQPWQWSAAAPALASAVPPPPATPSAAATSPASPSATAPATAAPSADAAEILKRLIERRKKEMNP